MAFHVDPGAIDEINCGSDHCGMGSPTFGINQDDTVAPTEKRQRFRALLAGQSCVHPADVFDPLSARMAEDLGFECGTVSSVP
jgi:hypothetical protein